MKIAFKFALNDAEFDLALGDYEADDLQFNSKIHTTHDNIAHIIQRWTAIDQINNATLRGRSTMRLRYIEVWRNILLCECLPIAASTPEHFLHKEKRIEFVLNASMYFYESDAHICWTPDRELPKWVHDLLDVHYACLRPVLIGTVQHYFPALKDQAKAIVKANALRRAKIMQGNAEAILQFLGEVV